jgi:hypothetical protein
LHYTSDYSSHEKAQPGVAEQCHLYINVQGRPHVLVRSLKIKKILVKQTDVVQNVGSVGVTRAERLKEPPVHLRNGVEAGERKMGGKQRCVP